jgi:hypothetical protein
MGKEGNGNVKGRTREWEWLNREWHNQGWQNQEWKATLVALISSRDYMDIYISRWSLWECKRENREWEWLNREWQNQEWQNRERMAEPGMEGYSCSLNK